MTNSPCRYVDGYGYYLRAHELGCKDRTCAGCQPCTHEQDGPRKGQPVRHCTARLRCTNHLDVAHPLSCAECAGTVRTQLEEISVWYVRDLMHEAVESGVNSEAAMLAGPAAEPGWIVEYGKHHPLDVLGRWDLMLREDYDQPTSERCTVVSASTYLRGMLGTIAQDSGQDFPLFVSEVSTCHTHLASVLHIAQRSERGAPCPACAKAPSLVKKYRNIDDLGKPDLTGSSDYWLCPACRARWSEADYRLWVSDDYVQNAGALTASQITEIYAVPEGTVRRWANEEPPRVRKRGYDGRRRQLYDVGDVQQARTKATTATAEGA